MAPSPLVSVAMPVRNGERYLAEAVDSILNQSFRDFEFVIVDDASEDGTWGILERYARADSRVRLLRHAAPNYLGAMNACCQGGRGRFIARMDADDISFPDRLERQVAFLEARPEVAVLGGNVVFIDDRGRCFGTKGNPCESAEIKKRLLLKNCLIHPTAVMRRTAVEAVGWYRLPFTSSQDYDLWLRIAEHCELAGLGQPVLYRRYHGDQVTFAKMAAQVTSSMIARVAARSRRETGRDPLDGVTELTTELLSSLGIEPALLSGVLIRRGLAMAKHMIRAGYLDQALSATEETVARARTGAVHRHGLAKAAKIRAAVYRRQGRTLKAMCAALGAGGHCLLLAAERLFARHKSPGLGEERLDDMDT